MLFHSADGLQIFSKGAGPLTFIAMLRKDATPAEIAGARRLLIGKTSQDSKQILLRLSASEVVQRTIRVPEAAVDLMESIVENKIETIVAWPLENTYYGYRVVGPNAATAEQVDTEIIATTRQIVDGALDRAREIGLTPRAVDFAPSPESPSVVELLRLEPDPVSKTAKRLNMVFAGLVACSLAACALGVYQVWMREVQFGELESQIAAVMTRVEEVRRLNEENTKIKNQRERLAKRKIDQRPIMELIEALSRALPDTAYLDEFEFRDNEARIIGKSPDPTGLIATLESTPEFEDVRFSAPTTREDGQTLGTFSIVGKVQSEGTPEKSK
jgi:general secretion pathway protein L